MAHCVILTLSYRLSQPITPMTKPRSDRTLPESGHNIIWLSRKPLLSSCPLARAYPLIRHGVQPTCPPACLLIRQSAFSFSGRLFILLHNNQPDRSTVHPPVCMSAYYPASRGRPSACMPALMSARPSDIPLPVFAHTNPLACPSALLTAILYTDPLGLPPVCMSADSSTQPISYILTASSPACLPPFPTPIRLPPAHPLHTWLRTWYVIAFLLTLMSENQTTGLLTYAPTDRPARLPAFRYTH